MSSEYTNPAIGDPKFTKVDLNKLVDSHYKGTATSSGPAGQYIYTQTNSAGSPIYTGNIPSNWHGIMICEGTKYYYQVNYDPKLNNYDTYVKVCEAMDGTKRYADGYNTWKTLINNSTFDMYERIIEFCESNKRRKHVRLEDIIRLVVQFEDSGNHKEDCSLVFTYKSLDDLLKESHRLLSLYKIPQYSDLLW